MESILQCISATQSKRAASCWRRKTGRKHETKHTGRHVVLDSQSRESCSKFGIRVPTDLANSSTILSLIKETAQGHMHTEGDQSQTAVDREGDGSSHDSERACWWAYPSSSSTAKQHR